MIDTHAHLNFPDYKDSLDSIIQNAQKSGVEKIICVGSSIGDSIKAVEISKKYPGIVYAAVGIHPQQTDTKNKDPIKLQVEKLKKLVISKEVVAIGECGLDYSPAPPPEKDRSKTDQEFLFEEQIELAILKNLPVIVHTRKAFDDTMKILEKYRKARGVVHCYSAGKKGIERVTNLDFYFGVDGNLTYDQGLQNVFSQIPLEKIILETDSPFLSPEPKRGQANEPGFLPYTVNKLAEIKNTSKKEVDKITTKTTCDIFRL